MSTSAAPKLLVVRHGPGRGRKGQFLEFILDHVARTDPALRDRIVIHETGSPEPSLNGIGRVFFWLADPLKELYPQCHAEAARIAATALQRGIGIANPPDALSNSIKSVQARLLAEAGITTPRHSVFESAPQLKERIHTFDFPLLLKSDQLHAQQGMRFCRNADELRAAVDEAGLAYPVAVAEFIDTREGYRGGNPLWARFYHKKRTIVLGDIVHPRHTIFSASPIVGLKSSTLKPFRGHGFIRRHALPLMPMARRSIEEDNRFFFEGDAHGDLMRRVCETLGVVTAAIDYSVDADGTAVIWEANPYFHLYAPRDYILPVERHFEERRERIFADATRFLAQMAR